jgi:hypothetical protein
MRNYAVPIIMFVTSAICFFSFRMIGSSVSADGQLVEPFFLIPIGYLAFFVGLIITIIVVLRNKTK